MPKRTEVTMTTIGVGLTREERETIIRISAADDCWDIYTSDPVMARKLEKLCEALGVTPMQVDQWGIRAALPCGVVRLNKLRQISDADRQQRAARLRARRATDGV